MCQQRRCRGSFSKQRRDRVADLNPPLLPLSLSASGPVHGVGLVDLPGRLRAAQLQVPARESKHRPRPPGEVSHRPARQHSPGVLRGFRGRERNSVLNAAPQEELLRAVKLKLIDGKGWGAPTPVVRWCVPTGRLPFHLHPTSVNNLVTIIFSRLP